MHVGCRTRLQRRNVRLRGESKVQIVKDANHSILIRHIGDIDMHLDDIAFSFHSSDKVGTGLEELGSGRAELAKERLPTWKRGIFFDWIDTVGWCLASTANQEFNDCYFGSG